MDLPRCGYVLSARAAIDDREASAFRAGDDEKPDMASRMLLAKI